MNCFPEQPLAEMTATSTSDELESTSLDHIGLIVTPRQLRML